MVQTRAIDTGCAPTTRHVKAKGGRWKMGRWEIEGKHHSLLGIQHEKPTGDSGNIQGGKWSEAFDQDRHAAEGITEVEARAAVRLPPLAEEAGIWSPTQDAMSWAAHKHHGGGHAGMANSSLVPAEGGHIAMAETAVVVRWVRPGATAGLQDPAGPEPQ